MRRSARKRLQKRGAEFNGVKLGVVALSILASLVIFGKILDFTVHLNEPFAPDSTKTARLFKWEGRENLNLAIKSDSTYVVSFNPVQKTITAVKIPDQTFTLVPFSFGFWKMGSVYSLGQSEKVPVGANLIKDTTAAVLGVHVDGYLLPEGKFASLDINKILDELRSNPVASFSLLRNSKTDLTSRELWSLIWGVRGVRFDKIKTFDLENLNLVKEEILADGSQILRPNPAEIDRFVQTNFESSGLKDEGLSIGIYNATDHPGLAEKAARMISNMGGRVIFTANADLPLGKSAVSGEPSKTSRFLSRIFAPSQGKKEMQGQNRADINVFLGEDYFLRYNTP